MTKATGSGEEWKKRLRSLGLNRRRKAVQPAENAGTSRMPTRPVGDAGEDLAVAFLVARGVRVLARNVRYADAEIDIVGALPGLVLFVEVKRRKGSTAGLAAESVTFRKRRRLITAASRWLADNPSPSFRNVRFDVVTVDGEPPAIAWITGAFDVS
ncbi:MAG: YraN family protein [Acidobacteria bacterium]|nr:YraN family protein [Acidobacteriota bacterium]